MLRIFFSISTVLFLLPNIASGLDLPESERTVIALFGDSITVGENLNLTGRPIPSGSTTHLGCPSVYLTGILLNEEPRSNSASCPTEGLSAPVYNGNTETRNAVVANWGIGGSNTDFGSSRMFRDLSATRAELVGRDYLVLIMYGTNDMNFGISSMTTRDNIDAMITTARSSLLRFTPIIGAVTPRDDRPSTGPSSIQNLNLLIREVARTKNAPFVDHFANFASFPGSFVNLLDQEQFGDELIRLHPNDQGYLLIAEAWFEQQLKALIPVVELPEEARRFSITPIISLLLDD